MAETPSLYASGTASVATSSTPTVLCAASVAGLFSFHLDFNALAAGDVYEVYLYRTILNGGTSRLEALLDRLTGAQPADQLIRSYSGIGNDLAAASAVTFSVAQIFCGNAGGRSVPWKVVAY